MQHDHIQNFYPLIQTTGWGSACREKICACMVLYAPFPVICYATWPCSKKVEFRPIDPTPRVEMGVKGEVCRQNICDHVAAFQIPFHNLICNMTMFWKSWIWPKDPIPGGRGGGGGPQPKYLLLCCCISWLPLFDMQQWPRSEKGWILTYWSHPQGRGRGAAVKIFGTWCWCILDSN